jgi:hypothetical protein
MEAGDADGPWNKGLASKTKLSSVSARAECM